MVYTRPSCPVRLFTPIKKSGRVDFFFVCRYLTIFWNSYHFFRDVKYLELTWNRFHSGGRVHKLRAEDFVLDGILMVSGSFFPLG